MAGTRLLTRAYDPRDTIVVFGSPRSGTTWLAQTLGSIPGSAVLFEPLHPRRVPQVKEAGFGWRTYVRPGTDWPLGRQRLEEAFCGRPLNGWTGSLMKRPARVATWIMKCIRANLLIPWISDWMQPRRRLLVIRHPCAVVSSQTEAGWDPPNLEFQRELLDDYPGIRAVIETCDSPEERRAIDWAVNTIVPLSHGSIGRWLIIPYERLASNESAFESILNRWSLEIPRDFERSFATWSHTARRRTERPDERTTTEWTTRLSPTQVDRILGVTHALGLDFYGKDPEPDDERLRRRLDSA